MSKKPESWDQIFMEMAHSMAKRSKDPSTQCGAVIVSQNNIVLSTGFNGPPPGINDEFVPWNERPNKYAYVIHAEENALWFAIESSQPFELKNARMYATHYPCAECTLRLIRSKIREVLIPLDFPEYQLNKYQITPEAIINAQKVIDTPLKIRRIHYVRV